MPGCKFARSQQRLHHLLAAPDNTPGDEPKTLIYRSPGVEYQGSGTPLVVP